MERRSMMRKDLCKVIAISCFLLLATSATVFAAEAIPATGSNLTADLSLGSSGEDVLAVQQQLLALGYDPGPLDAYFGTVTEDAVVLFQIANGLYVDGVVGPITMNALFDFTPSQAYLPEEPAYLSLGSTGEDVLAIQVQLHALGYDPGPLDGYFVVITEEAVVLFQMANGLYVDGVVGPITMNALYSSASAQASVPAGPAELSLGSSGEDVLAVQVQLHALGYDPGPLDGYFGPLTEAAVKEFQAANGLYVDGVVGPITYNALFGEIGEAPAGASAEPPAAAFNTTKLTFHEDGWYVARLEVELWDKEKQSYEWIYSDSRAKGQKTTVSIDTDKYEINRVGYQIWFFGWDNDYMNLPWANTDYATDFTLSGSGDYPEFSWK